MKSSIPISILASCLLIASGAISGEVVEVGIAPAENESTVKEEVPRVLYEGTVTRVASADTLEIDGVLVHLMGVASPQMWWWGKPKDCLAAEGAKYVEDAVLNQTVQWAFDHQHRWRDHRGWIRVYLYKGDQFINADLISNGLALTDRSRDYREKENFLALEADATLHFMGLWHTCPVECYRRDSVCRVKNW